MSNYFKDELLSIVDSWTVEELNNYIQQLEDRVTHTRDQIHALKIMRRKKLRNKNLKDTSGRGGKG